MKAKLIFTSFRERIEGYTMQLRKDALSVESNLKRATQELARAEAGPADWQVDKGFTEARWREVTRLPEKRRRVEHYAARFTKLSAQLKRHDDVMTQNLAIGTDAPESLEVLLGWENQWLFEDRIFITPDADLPIDVQVILVKEANSRENQQQEEAIARTLQEIDNIRNRSVRVSLDHVRQPIPGNVRIEVWRRDQGQCVKCGSRNRLEYDHIIPVSRGGSNTARNIELLCESCNRAKSNHIT
jgi:hypothetical protein